jgi:hypothetical protein
MKACTTISGAFAWAVAAGIGGGAIGAVIMAPLGPDGPAIGAVMGALACGLSVLLLKFPRWESDL